jgi:hypothetical protein
MSYKRQTERRDPRSPFREPTTSRMSAGGPKEQIVTPRDVAIFFREDCRTLRDSLQLEMVVAQYFPRLRDAVSSAGVPVGEAVGAGVVAELEGHGDELSHAILRGLAHLATGDIGRRSADAAARLRERSVGLPNAFADVGQAVPVGAWRTTKGAFAGEVMLFADFEYPTGSPHSVAVFIEPRRGGAVKHIGLLNPLSELELDDGPFHPDARETIELEAAGELLREVLERTHGPLVAESDDYRVLIAAARARSMTLARRAPSAPVPDS